MSKYIFGLSLCKIPNWPKVDLNRVMSGVFGSVTFNYFIIAPHLELNQSGI